MQLIDFILHIDDYLSVTITQYGSLTYGFLFLVIFCETGLVVMPFLPGDSLLFAAGTFAATGSLDPVILIVLLTAAAILGDAVNYSTGRFFGPKAFARGGRIFKQEYLHKTQAFYKRHGKKTIILARFVPIVRTFAPFVAGVGGMPYSEFAFYNIAGGILWVMPFVGGGYLFGNIPVVRENFELVILAIIVVSLLPGLHEWWKHRRATGNGH
ncbi:MAG: membrane-associated protein [Candidatus Peregrinibacteria bacterium Greene1014_49]|nr:MAG: membrane-associated protein [Candidatus Peregrinibacteria bacterium Greene1014_49]